MVKNLLSMQKTWVQSLDQEDPLEKEMATYSSILAWEIPWQKSCTKLGKTTTTTTTRFDIAFLPRSKCLWFSGLQSLSKVILDTKKWNLSISTFPLSIWLEVIRPDVIMLGFWKLSFMSPFPSHLSPSSRSFLVPLHFLPLEQYHLHIWCYWYFSWQSWSWHVSSSPVFCIMQSTYKLNQHSDNILPCHTPFLIMNQSVVPHTMNLFTK